MNQNEKPEVVVISEPIGNTLTIKTGVKWYTRLWYM